MCVSVTANKLPTRGVAVCQSRPPQALTCRPCTLQQPWGFADADAFAPAGILHGAGLWQLPKQLYQPAEEKFALSPNSHLKYVW